MKAPDNFVTFCPGDWQSAFAALVELCEAEGYEVGIAGDEIHFISTPTASRSAINRRQKKH